MTESVDQGAPPGAIRPLWAQRLRQLRTNACLTQTDAAKAYGVSLRSIINWERGMQGAQMHLRRKVLAYYDIPLTNHREYFGPLQFEPTLPPAEVAGE